METRVSSQEMKLFSIFCAEIPLRCGDNICQHGYFPFYFFLSAFLGCLSTVKSVISQYAPDVALRAEHWRKPRPSAASIRSPSARHLTVKVPNSHSSDTIWPRSQTCSSINGPCESTAAPLKADVLFDPILDFKGGHLSRVLGEVGEAWGRTACRNSHCQKPLGPPLLTPCQVFNVVE